MKLSSRFTAAIGLSALLLLGGAGVRQLRSEERDLRGVAEGEALLLGRSLQTAFENALRDRQIEDVTETLQALAHVDRSVAIFVFDEEGHLVGASTGAIASHGTLALERRARSSLEPIVEFLEHEEPPLLRLGLRLRDETPDSPSAIVLEKPLRELERDLDATRRAIALAVVAFVATVASLSWMLTRRYVASPLARLASNMRRVRAGDLHVEPSETSDDEVGSTLVEFDLLVRELDDARLRADQEFDARQRMERGLQDADKLITLGQLSAVMAHEIGSPLQILEGRARALLRHADDPAATRRTAGMMVEQTERITRMVQQMLSITRRRMRVVTAVDAERLVRGVVALLEVEARRRSVRVAVQSAGDATCAADADQLQQVVLNLVRNALDASPHGGAITIALCGDDGWITLDVGDEGPGIPAESKSHLFEPFFTTKAQEGGSGLGLSVVRSIVQEHAGSVEFVEGEARGACVRVRIPRSHGEGRS